MWQLSWMFGVLPEWFWTLLLIAGALGILASWVLKLVPFVSNYRLLIQVVSIIALLLGVFYKGFYANEAKWQAKVKELEDKIAELQEASQQENVIIKEVIVYKDRIIREKGKTQIEYIDRIVKGDTEFITKDMSETERAEFKKKQEELEYALKMCPVPKIIVEEHNKAATKINDAAKGEKK